MKIEVLYVVLGLLCFDLNDCSLLDDGNYFQYELEYIKLSIGQTYNPPPLSFRRFAAIVKGAYNALTYYHPTAKPTDNLNIMKRPEEEWTIRNKNIAIAYATYRISVVVIPELSSTMDRYDVIKWT